MPSILLKEYKPDPVQVSDEKKRRKSEDVPPAAEDVIPTKKQRIAHAATSELRSSASQPIARPPAKLSPGMMMIERFKKMKESDIYCLVTAVDEQLNRLQTHQKYMPVC